MTIAKKEERRNLTTHSVAQFGRKMARKDDHRKALS